MKKVLITGGNGYLGQRIAKHYLDQGQYRVLLWVHARDASTIEKKLDALQAIYGNQYSKLTVYWGDLIDNDPFEGVATNDIEHIVHTAAVIDFNVEAETAAAVNVEGTRKVCEFARQCQNLKSFGFISSLYASGLHGGDIEEAPFVADKGHANFYEWSKWAAEDLLIQDFSDLPWKILRVGTIIADNEEGHVTQFNAVHNTLKLFYYGLLSIIPGLEDTPLYLATGDYVASSVYDAMHLPDDNLIFHITHNKHQAITLGEFIELANSEFHQDIEFASRRIMKPLYTDSESFDMLAKGVDDFGGSMVKRALATVKPFSAQLFINKNIITTQTQDHLSKHALPLIPAVVKQTCRHLVQTRFKQGSSHASH